MLQGYGCNFQKHIVKCKICIEKFELEAGEEALVG